MTNRIVKASEFKARCLELMDEVAATGETITVTKHGKPVAELRSCGRSSGRGGDSSVAIAAGL